ncbi:MAG TPA: DUF4159 domain-containing protein [Alphaproteobacteria bacterium]
MTGLGALSFAVPWALAALAALPVIWWLLRLNPPAPRRIAFPAIRLLFGLKPAEETPTHTPLWLLLLRLALAALVIVAIAQPLLNAQRTVAVDGPVVLVIDDGWAAAPGWEKRLDVARTLLEEAQRRHRPAAVAGTAPTTEGAGGLGGFAATGLVEAGEAQSFVRVLAPKPWPAARAAAAEALAASLPALGDAEVVWLSDGLADAEPGATERFAERLADIGPLTVYADAPAERAKLLLAPDAAAARMTVRVVRAAARAGAAAYLLARDGDGRVLGRQAVAFADGAVEAEVALELPGELRNEVARIELEGESSAGAVVLVDERWRRRPVGLVSGGAFEQSQPFLSDLYYLDRALSPFAEVQRGDIDGLLASPLSVLMLSDVGQLPDAIRQRLAAWIESGGLLVRFAGPRLAERVDDLVPVMLRAGGGRALGGALSWDKPMRLSPFDAESPFAGLAIPDDVVVKRQVLAEPSLGLAERSWARLEDGTPLVTAAPRGRGWLVLFHTTANTDWSSLALSGLFVDMLQRIVSLSEGVAGPEGEERLQPLTGLDGFGRLGDPLPEAAPVAARELGLTRAGPRHPPGEYGNRMQRRALNLGTPGLAHAAFGELAGAATMQGYGALRTVDLQPPLLAAAFVIALADLVIALAFRGLLPVPAAARGAAVIVAAALAAAAVAPPGEAQEPGDEALAALTQDTHLAYVRTGDAEVDGTSLTGLSGLTTILQARTAIEAGEPVAVDPESDELAFFPLIYWPMTDGQGPLSDGARAHVAEYLRLGGMILFDTRDQSPVERLGGDRPHNARLATLLSGLNVPPLLPVPQDHALTRSFYLIDHFPGRWDGGQVWVERYEGDVNDGVSSIVIGGNDYAAAWALDGDGYPLYPVVPGGNRQRELAFRFGVNLVMYALTGNYKADQVHIPAILSRLGRARPDLTD